MLIYFWQRLAEVDAEVDKVAEKKSENCRINKLETMDEVHRDAGHGKSGATPQAARTRKIRSVWV